MFVALWEYEVKLCCEERFENAYGRTVTGYGCSGKTPTTMRRGWCGMRYAVVCI